MEAGGGTLNSDVVAAKITAEGERVSCEMQKDNGSRSLKISEMRGGNVPASGNLRASEAEL